MPILEDKDEALATRQSLSNLIASLLNRYKNNPKSNIKDILMLIAALNVLNGNTNNPEFAVATARRLISGSGTGKM